MDREQLYPIFHILTRRFGLVKFGFTGFKKYRFHFEIQYLNINIGTIRFHRDYNFSFCEMSPLATNHLYISDSATRPPAWSRVTAFMDTVGLTMGVRWVGPQSTASSTSPASGSSTTVTSPHPPWVGLAAHGRTGLLLAVCRIRSVGTYFLEPDVLLERIRIQLRFRS